MRQIKEGEMIWSMFFQDWIKVIKILEDGYFYFSLKGRVQRSQSKLSVFCAEESI